MKKNRLVWAVLTAFLSTSVATLAFADDDEREDADVPSFSKIDKAEYRRLRDEHFSLMRGVPHFLPYEPRSRALLEMAAREAATASIDPAFWTPIGPAPIPQGPSRSAGAPSRSRSTRRTPTSSTSAPRRAGSTARWTAA